MGSGKFYDAKSNKSRLGIYSNRFPARTNEAPKKEDKMRQPNPSTMKVKVKLISHNSIASFPDFLFIDRIQYQDKFIYKFAISQFNYNLIQIKKCVKPKKLSSDDKFLDKYKFYLKCPRSKKATPDKEMCTFTGFNIEFTQKINSERPVIIAQKTRTGQDKYVINKKSFLDLQNSTFIITKMCSILNHINACKTHAQFK